MEYRGQNSGAVPPSQHSGQMGNGDTDPYDINMDNNSLSPSMREDGQSRYNNMDKQIVKSALKDLKNNYK